MTSSSLLSSFATSGPGKRPMTRNSIQEAERGTGGRVTKARGDRKAGACTNVSVFAVLLVQIDYVDAGDSLEARPTLIKARWGAEEPPLVLNKLLKVHV